VYDLERDFSKELNPSAPWTLGWKPTLTGPLNIYQVPRAVESDNGVAIDTWSSGPETALVEHNGTTNTAIGGAGAEVMPPGTVILGAGHEFNSDLYTVARLAIPSGGSGTYQVEIGVHSRLDGPTAGDSDFHIFRNGSEIFGQNIPGNGSATYSNTISLNAGEYLDFIEGNGADGQNFGSGLKFASKITRVSSSPDPDTALATFDLSRDFSTTTNPSGVWTFGYLSSFTSPLSVYARYIHSPDPASPNVPWDIWTKPSGGYPNIYHNGNAITGYSDGGHGVYPPGTTWFFPGEAGTADTYGAIRFTVPNDGAGDYEVATAVRGYLDGVTVGDTDFHVLRNGVELFSQFLAPASATAY